MRMGINLIHVVNLPAPGFEKDISGQGERQGPGAHTGTERRARIGWIDTPMHGSATRNPFPSFSWRIVVAAVVPFNAQERNSRLWESKRHSANKSGSLQNKASGKEGGSRERRRGKVQDLPSPNSEASDLLRSLYHRRLAFIT